MTQVKPIDQCAQIFEAGRLILRYGLKTGHKGPHRASFTALRELDAACDLSREESPQEVTLP